MILKIYTLIHVAISLVGSFPDSWSCSGSLSGKRLDGWNGAVFDNNSGNKRDRVLLSGPPLYAVPRRRASFRLVVLAVSI